MHLSKHIAVYNIKGESWYMQVKKIGGQGIQDQIQGVTKEIKLTVFTSVWHTHFKGMMKTVLT